MTTVLSYSLLVIIWHNSKHSENITLDFKTIYLHNKYLAICTLMSDLIWIIYWGVWKSKRNRPRLPLSVKLMNGFSVRVCEVERTYYSTSCFQSKFDARTILPRAKCEYLYVSRWVWLAGQTKAVPTSAQHHWGRLRLHRGRRHPGNNGTKTLKPVM